MERNNLPLHEPVLLLQHLGIQGTLELAIRIYNFIQLFYFGDLVLHYDGWFLFLFQVGLFGRGELGF